MNKRFDFDREKLQGFDYLIGTDEAGRGPGAGPVFAAAVCFISYDDRLSKLNDSKQLSEKVREELFDIIKENSIWAIYQKVLHVLFHLIALNHLVLINDHHKK